MDTKTEEQTAAPQQTSASTGAITVAPGAAPLDKNRPIIWSKERIDLLKRMKMPVGTTDDEFAIFLEQCLRTGMDPLIDEADCVPRKKKVKIPRDGPRGKWIEEVEVETKVFQPREAGMRARADRFDDYRGISSAAVREGDDCEVDKANFKVRHVFKPSTARDAKPVIGAWSQIRRAGRECEPVYLSIREMLVENNPLWKEEQKRARMAEKAVRAEALRREYPNAFGGLYTREEFEAREVRELNPPPEGTVSPPATKTEAVLDKVKQKVSTLAGPPPEDAQLVDVPLPPADAAPAAAQPPPPASPPKKAPVKKAPVKRAPGTFRNQQITMIDRASLQKGIADCEAYLKAKPLTPESTDVRAALDDLNTELQRRIEAAAAVGDQPPREPGSDDDAPF